MEIYNFAGSWRYCRAKRNKNKYINKMNYKTRSTGEAIKFKCFSRKGYSLFSCLGKEVIIGTLSVATLSHAKAEGIGAEPLRQDTISVATEDDLSLIGAEAEKEISLEEVSVRGSRAPMLVGQTSRRVDVIAEEAIREAPIESVNDLLKYVAGVDVRQKGALGALTDVSIRGGTSDQITILLNGINICDAQTGHNSFDLPVDINEIERIEVLEGPAGRVYGTSSLYGAINIITKPREHSGISAHAEGGSYGYLSGGALGGITKESGSHRFGNQLSASYGRSDGFSRSASGNLNGDYRTGKAFYQGLYEEGDVIKVNWHAGFSLKDFGSNTFYGTGSDDQYEHTFKSFTALQAETKAGRLVLNGSFYWNHQEDRFEYYRGDDGLVGGVAFNYHKANVLGANLNGWWDWILGRTALSVELRNEDLLSTTLGEELETPKHISGTDRYYTNGLNRTNINLVAEHNILWRGFALSAGIVAAKNSWGGRAMKVYPGIDLSYRLREDLKIYASWNTSLRQPSATELYYSVGGHKADKYLKPEELMAIEGGIRYYGKGIKAGASLYYNHCKNVIDWIYDTEDGDEAVWQSVNLTRINTFGLELDLGLDLRSMFPGQYVMRSLSLEYSYISQDKDIPSSIQSKYSLEYLKHKLVGTLGLSITDCLGLGINVRWQDRTGSYTDTEGDVRAYEPYVVVDGRLTWHKPTYKIYLEANNLFGTTYVDYGNVPQPGTWVVAGLSLDINL